MDYRYNYEYDYPIRHSGETCWRRSRRSTSLSWRWLLSLHWSVIFSTRSDCIRSESGWAENIPGWLSFLMQGSISGENLQERLP